MAAVTQSGSVTVRTWLARLVMILIGCALAIGMGAGLAAAQDGSESSTPETSSTQSPSDDESESSSSDDEEGSESSSDDESSSDSGESDAAKEDFSTPFDAMELEDSSGISPWRYEMAIDQGSASSPEKTVPSLLIQMIWNFYRLCVALGIWLIGWVLSFEWLDWLFTPVAEISENLHSIVDALGLVPVFLTIAAFTAGIMMLRGKTTTFVYDLILVCAIAALGTGALNDPVGMVAGDDGYLTKSRDAGLEFAAGMAGQDTGSGSSGELIQATQTELVDTLVRQPTQLINFGRVIDTDSSPECIHEWETGHENHPGNDADTVKDNVAKCGDLGESMKDYADNPSMMGVVLAGMFLVNGIIVANFFTVFAFLIFLSVFLALWTSLLLIWNLVWGLLPGPSRGGLMKSFAELVVSVISVAVLVLAAQGFMQLLQGLFAASEGKNLVLRMIFIFIMEVISIIVIIILWLRMRRQGKGLADLLSKRPGAAPSPSAVSHTAPSAARTYLRTKALAKTAGAVAGMVGSGGTAAPAVAGHAAQKAASAGTRGAAAAAGAASALPKGKGGDSPALARGGDRPNSLPPGGDRPAPLPPGSSGSSDSAAPPVEGKELGRNTRGIAPADSGNHREPSAGSSVRSGGEAPAAHQDSSTSTSEHNEDRAQPSRQPRPAVNEVIDGEVVSVRSEPIPNKEERQAFRARSNPRAHGVSSATPAATASTLSGSGRGGRR